MLFCSTQFFAQEHKKTSVSVTSLNFEVDSAKEFDTINWDDIKEIFSENKPDEKVSLSFKIKAPKSKSKMRSEFKVTSKTKDLDKMIALARKSIKGIINRSNK